MYNNSRVRMVNQSRKEPYIGNYIFLNNILHSKRTATIIKCVEHNLELS